MNYYTPGDLLIMENSVEVETENEGLENLETGDIVMLLELDKGDPAHQRYRFISRKSGLIFSWKVDNFHEYNRGRKCFIKIRM